MSARAAALAIALASLASCGGSGPAVAHPVPSLAGARIRGGGLGAIVVRADLVVANPNAFAVELEAIDWELSLAGAAVTGRSRQAASIPPRGRTPIDLLLRVPPAAAAPMTARMAGGAVAMRLGGVMYFASEQGAIVIPFELATAAE